jgi:amino acid transporter
VATAQVLDDDDAQGDSDVPPLGLPHLFALALGGVIGSGWLLAPTAKGMPTGWYAIIPWLAGGAVMAAIAVVMVELGRRVPKTGGLISWPRESSGPYVATIAAAALWIFYALNPVTEAAAATKGLTAWFGGLYTSGTYESSAPTVEGYGLTAVLLVVITVVNILAPRWFLRVNVVVTAVKMVVPVAVVLLLCFSSFNGNGVSTHYALPPGNEFSHAVSAITSAGVLYAFVGFQAPLDFAGRIRDEDGDGRRRTARLRWSVYGTVAGSVLLYTALEAIFLRHTGLHSLDPDSPYSQFAYAASLGWASWFIRRDAVLSPLGAGMVFSFALTREVKTLSRVGLVHSGLGNRKRWHTDPLPFGNPSYQVFWVILLVNMVIGLLADTVIGLITLAGFNGSWQSLTSAMSVVTLVLYAMPAVSLIAFGRARGAAEPDFKLSLAETGLAWVTFTLIAMVLYGGGWATVWPGMTALGIGVLLLTLPPYLRDNPSLKRYLSWYKAPEAANLIANLRNWRSAPDVQAGLVLVGYLIVLLLLTLGRRGTGPLGLILVVPASIAAFWSLTRLSTDYLKDPKSAAVSSAESVGEPHQLSGAQGDPDSLPTITLGHISPGTHGHDEEPL